MGGSEDTVGPMMDTFADFETLLAEGTAVGAFSEQQQKDLEQLHYDYTSTVRAMHACLNEMDRRVTLAKRSTVNAA